MKNQIENWFIEFRQLFPSLADDLNMGAALAQFIENKIAQARKEEREKILKEIKLSNSCPNEHPYAPEMCPCRIKAQDELEDLKKLL